jgi:hypothetical protein
MCGAPIPFFTGRDNSSRNRGGRRALSLAKLPGIKPSEYLRRGIEEVIVTASNVWDGGLVCEKNSFYANDDGFG